MFVKFTKIRFKNFLSVGNTWCEIQLDANQSTMIIGDNGAGKSTINEAIYYGCFGKSYRNINLEKLVNRKNQKGLEVELFFLSGQNEIFVRRTMYPDNFEVQVNGVMIPQTNRKKYQKSLNGFLGCDYITSSQIIFIGKGQHQPFMKLESWKRRYFVESIVNLLIFGKMSEIANARAGKVRTKVSELKSAVAVTKEKIKLRKKYITDLEAVESASNVKEQESIDRKAGELSERILVHMTEIDGIDRPSYDLKEHNAAKAKMRELNIIHLDDKANSISLKRSIDKIINSKVCESCGQDISSEIHDARLKGLQQELFDVDVKIAELDLVRLSIEQTLIEFMRIQEVNNIASAKINSIEGNIQALTAERDALFFKEANQSHTADEIEKAKKVLHDLEETLKLLTQKFELETGKEANLKVLSGILSDSGLKASILAQIVPVLNQFVNQFLSKLGLFASFHLDENFNDSIKVLGFDESPYNAFSEGEKLRIDLAVLLAWREIAKLSGSFETNLLFFDEIFDSSLDTDGAESLAELLNESPKLNVFVITHTPEKIADRVEAVIKVSKIDGYTSLETL